MFLWRWCWWGEATSPTAGGGGGTGASSHCGHLILQPRAYRLVVIIHPSHISFDWLACLVRHSLGGAEMLFVVLPESLQLLQLKRRSKSRGDCRDHAGNSEEACSKIFPHIQPLFTDEVESDVASDFLGGNSSKNNWSVLLSNPTSFCDSPCEVSIQNPRVLRTAQCYQHGCLIRGNVALQISLPQKVPFFLTPSFDGGTVDCSSEVCWNWVINIRILLVHPRGK